LNWIRSVVEAHSESEASERFFYWCALAAMSAVIKKNIFLDRHEFRVYPNIYVFLVAKSGMKKGIPIALAKRLVELEGSVRIVSGRNSMPRIIQDLGKIKTNANGTVPSKLAQALIVSGELASFLVKDPDALTILTDLYNTHEHEKEWVNSLKGTGVDTLKEPCLTLLGATNEDHFVGAVPQADVKGGFIARTFVVYSTDTPKPNALVRKPIKLVNNSDFVPFLKDLSKLNGEFKWTAETGNFFETWYNDFAMNRPDDSTGTYQRIDKGIIKIAMLLSLSKSFSLRMDLDALQEAKAECMECARGAHQISMGGTSTISGQTRIVMQALLSHPDHKLTRAMILKKFWGDIDSYTIDLVAETLLGAGAIEVFHQGKETIYVMKSEIVKEYLEYERKTRNMKFPPLTSDSRL